MKDFGLLVVDKPIGPTSHKVVNIVRKGTRVRKVGHAGTLDPRASGVLVLCLGAATRLSEFLSTSSKQYEAVIRFGISTDTYDADGEVVRETSRSPDQASIEAALDHFRGEIEQMPPPYSAIKIRGRKAYELARQGKQPDLEPRQVTIHKLATVSYHPPELALQIECSAGTYIRALANDLGEFLSTGAHLAALRRTKAGPFHLKQAVAFRLLQEKLADGTWEELVLPAASALPDMASVTVDPETVERIRHGHRFPAEPGSQGMAKAVDPQGELVAILEFDGESGLWHPRKVFLPS